MPTFLTPRIFSLEFIIQKLIVENEHFLSFRNSYEIKFPLKVGPFIIKNKAALSVGEGLLQDMNFMNFEVMRAGFYWPTIFFDTHKKFAPCHKCQIFEGRRNLLPFPLKPIQVEAPF